MAVSSHSAGSGVRHITNILAILADFGTKTLAKGKTALKLLQTARMMSALSNMTDHQLDEIGISRSEIPQYAEKLIGTE